MMPDIIVKQHDLEGIAADDSGEPPGTKPENGVKQATTETLSFRKDATAKPQSRETFKRARRPVSFVVNQKTREFINRFYPQVSLNDWNDWRWQIRNRVRRVVDLAKFLNLSESESRAFAASQEPIPLSITPYYLSLLDQNDHLQPLRRTVVPTDAESHHGPGEKDDPLGEDGHSPVPGLVHRYPDRVLFLATGFCSTYCRYCTRSRLVGRSSGCQFSRKQWEKAIAYIESTPTIRDVLISGGDPLTLADEVLEFLLSRLRAIPHVEFLRIGTKVPVVLPQRITPALTRMLKKYHPLWMSIHFSHPDELTSETQLALKRLANAGIPLGSQTVLLKGINDDVSTMKGLMHGLLRSRVRPYYIYQCDPITGSAHFRTSVATGLDIMRGLRGHTTGYAVPHYVIDAPGGGGKIPLLPEYFVERIGEDVVLRNYEDRYYRYPDVCQ